MAQGKATPARPVNPGSHAHHYAAHPSWVTHVYCTVTACGLAIPRALLRYAVEHGATCEAAIDPRPPVGVRAGLVLG